MLTKDDYRVLLSLVDRERSNAEDNMRRANLAVERSVRNGFADDFAARIAADFKAAYMRANAICTKLKRLAK